MSLQSTLPVPSTKDRLWALLVVVGMMALVSWTMILSGNHSGRGAADDYNYHWLAIQQFANELPNPDITDYDSATTPGYHLILSGFVRAGIGHMGIQLIASVWALAFVGVMSWVVSARFGKMTALIMLPMITSQYVLFPGVWLLPDNAGWFGVLIILLLSLQANTGWRTWALGGVVLVLLVWMRQVHIWAAGIIWLSAWLGGKESTPSVRTLFSSCFERSGRTLIAIGCTIPAAAALVWFIALWGGLVPPTFQSQHQGPNLATPGFFLTQLAIMSVFFVPILWPKLKESWAYHWRWILLAAIVGLIFGIVPESSYSEEAGRYGGWWQLVGKLPTIADRSPMIILGSIAGAISFTVWLQLASLRDRWIWVGVMVAFVLSQSMNHASWQRYHEPMLLIMIILILARSTVIEQYNRRVLAGCVAMAFVFGGLTAGAMLKAKPIEIENQQAIIFE